MWRRHVAAGLAPAGLIAVTVVFAVADAADQSVSGGALFPGGLLDEAAHLLTTLLVLWAIGGVVFERLLIPAIVASVAIDLDHLPGDLGHTLLADGTPRPYTHSLLTIMVLMSVAPLLGPRRRVLLLGIAAGLALHFWRDMCEPGSGVALLWPFSYASDHLPHWTYLAVMAVVVMVGLRRSLLLTARRASSRRARSARPDLRPAQPRVAGSQGSRG